MDIPVSAKAALLQALIRGEGFGLELIDRVAKATKGQLLLNQGSVYPALKDLEREGLVTTRQGDGPDERRGRPRVYYKLTAMGVQAAMSDTRAVAGLFGLTLEGT